MISRRETRVSKPFDLRAALPLRAWLEALHRPIKVVVTGGRDYRDDARVAWALGGLHSKYGISRLAHGAARGADTLARDWAEAQGIEVQPYAADWARWDRGPDLPNPAGQIRNRDMLREEKPDLVVAFPGAKGTAGCREAASTFGIRVWEVS